jgi:Domain of unknown function (DUF4124)
MRQAILLMILMLATVLAEASVFKCNTPDGVVYSEQPCSENATEIDVHAADPLPPQQSSSEAGGEGTGGLAGNSRINDASAVPYLTEGGRARYREFLTHSNPRAFMVCPDGSFTTIYGEAANSASVREKDSRGCMPYAINDEVVWGR